MNYTQNTRHHRNEAYVQTGAAILLALLVLIVCIVAGCSQSPLLSFLSGGFVWAVMKPLVGRIESAQAALRAYRSERRSPRVAGPPLSL